MELRTVCDMGNIKIFTKDVSLFFDNSFGDAETVVEILEKEPKEMKKKNIDMLGHFTVKTKAYLSNYDCEDNPIYTFNKGRYFVYLIKPLHIIIVREDENINC